jgi:hypothetical protein
MAILPEKRPVVPWQLARPLAALSTERVRAVIVPAYLTTNPSVPISPCRFVPSSVRLKSQ